MCFLVFGRPKKGWSKRKIQRSSRVQRTPILGKINKKLKKVLKNLNFLEIKDD
jgi:hypothetical protein